MKKTFLFVALATALVLAFSGVAYAKNAGYAYNIDGDNHVGYLSWQGAVAAADYYSGGTADMSTPHGGYTANTVKCAVCHSAHRAASNRTTAGVGADWKLTAGGASCAACHTPSGSNPTSTLVEWSSAYADGGPHNRQNCTGACHGGGIHGAGGSSYAVARQFMLNPVLDATMAADVAAGNVKPGVVDATTLNTPWASLPNGAVRASNRAMVTGYLCGQSGCHTASQFAVNTPGFAGMRGENSAVTNVFDIALTGHSTSGPDHCASAGCHNAISTTSQNGGPAGPGINDSKCAACHDMVGVATNSSAWPHSNRNIAIYEWERPNNGPLTLTSRDIGRTYNLWMYTGDVTYRDANGEPTSTPMWDGVSTYMQNTDLDSVNGLRPSRINTRTLNENAVGFHAPYVGNINDGVCLKCHGYMYWPFHGSGSLGNPASSHFDRNFANY